MAFATYVHVSRGDPFVAKGGGGSYELAAAYLTIVLSIALLGPGRYSVDQRIAGRRVPNDY
jgi:uncharacterized membrane protein YphA (DoxX/SURF4 family)